MSTQERITEARERLATDNRAGATLLSFPDAVRREFARRRARIPISSRAGGRRLRDRLRTGRFGSPTYGR